MTDIRFADTAPILGMRRTQDGYLYGEVRCARSGCQTYLGSEIGIQDRATVTVYRPETAVFDKSSLATFAGKPVTVGHPAQPVTAENWRGHAVGDVGDEVARDGEFVKVPFRLMDAAAIASVSAGTREVSMGYTTPVVMRDGIAPDGTRYDAIQTGPIRINHLAIVPTARGGDQLRIGDGATTWGASPVTPSAKGNAIMADALINVVLGDKAVPIEPTHAPTIEAWKVDTAKRLTDAEAAHAAAIAAKDTEIGALKAENKKMADAAMTPDKVSRLVADRVALEGTAKAIFADAKTEGVADSDLRKAVVAHKLGDEMVKDASDAEVSGMFRAIAKDVATVDRVADGIKSGVKMTDAASTEAAAYAAYLADFNAPQTEAN